MNQWRITFVMHWRWCGDALKGHSCKIGNMRYSGHPNIKISNFMKKVIFNGFLPWHNILWLKNWFGNLVAHLTHDFVRIQCPEETRKKIYSTFGQKNGYTAHIKCQGPHLILKKYKWVNLYNFSYSFCPKETVHHVPRRPKFFLKIHALKQFRLVM